LACAPGSWPPSSSRNRRHDRDLVAVLDRRVQVFQKPDVLVADEDVDESADRARVVADALFDAGIVFLEGGDHLGDGVTNRRDLFLVLGQLAQRGRNANGCHGHASLLARASNSLSDGPIRVGGSSREARGSVVLRPLPVTETTIDSVRGSFSSSSRRSAAASVTPPAVSAKMPSVWAKRRIAATISSSETAAAWPPDSRIARIA